MATAAPTTSHAGRSLWLKLAAPMGCPFAVVHVTGAFVESPKLEETAKWRVEAGGLYCSLPPGGIPGVPEVPLVRLDLPVCGLADAPALWWKTVKKAMLDLGFVQGEIGRLGGAACWHVDDILAVGGSPGFSRGIDSLKKRVPFSKRSVNQERFCGVNPSRDAATGEISMGQKEYAGQTTPPRPSKVGEEEAVSPDHVAKAAELRAVNGAGRWLSFQSRPDLACQVSIA